MWQDNIILNNTNISKFKLWKRMVTLEKLYFIIFFIFQLHVYNLTY